MIMVSRSSLGEQQTERFRVNNGDHQESDQSMW